MTDSSEPGKERVQASIAHFQAIVDDAPIEEVDTPTARKSVEIAFEDRNGEFVVREGEALGVYFEPSRDTPERVSIDWSEDDRTSVDWQRVEYFDESEYYVPSGESLGDYGV